MSFVSGTEARMDQEGLAGRAGLPQAEADQGLPRGVSPEEARSFPDTPQGSTTCRFSLDLHTSLAGQPWTGQAQGTVFGSRKLWEPWSGPYLCSPVHFQKVSGEVLF